MEKRKRKAEKKVKTNHSRMWISTRTFPESVRYRFKSWPTQTSNLTVTNLVGQFMVMYVFNVPWQCVCLEHNFCSFKVVEVGLPNPVPTRLCPLCFAASSSFHSKWGICVSCFPVMLNRQDLTATLCWQILDCDEQKMGDWLTDVAEFRSLVCVRDIKFCGTNVCQPRAVCMHRALER